MMKFVAFVIIGISIGAFSLSAFATNQYDACFIHSAKKYNLDLRLIKAIAQVESSFNPNAINKNETSVDIGMMQINSSWLSKLEKKGIYKQDLFDPCINIEVGSWILANNIASYGATWNAVGAYNARSIDKRKIYVAKVKQVYYRNVAENRIVNDVKKIRVI